MDIVQSWMIQRVELTHSLLQTTIWNGLPYWSLLREREESLRAVNLDTIRRHTTFPSMCQEKELDEGIMVAFLSSHFSFPPC